MTLADVYKLAAKKGAPGEKARRLLRQTDWLARMVDFDPRSGEALSQALTPFLRRVAVDALPASIWKYRDRLARLTDHCRHSLEHVIAALNESPRREHTEMPLRSVRELDAACFMKLSSRPGRTIREKIAAKPSLLAVRRYQSVDLPENRLVKAFAMRLVELLRERSKCLGDGPTDQMETFERWLRSDVARTISHWDNPPPNNVLLSHRDYRRIYDAWCWLQTLDADVEGDFERLEARKVCIEFWRYVADLRFRKAMRLEEIPLVFDYGSFTIRPLQSDVLPMSDARGRLNLPIGESLRFKPQNRIPDPDLPEVAEPVCVDFCGETPVFSSVGRPSERLPVCLAWQLWKTPDESVEMSLLEAQRIHTGKDVTTILASDFFTSPEDVREHAPQAALSIGSDMRRVFRNDSFAWLVPDIVGDFQLTPLRQAINSVFSDATPIPRSIAAVIQKVDVKKIEKDEEFSVAVIDRMGEDFFVTKLVARFDKRLKAVMPEETRGYAWERQPAIRINSGRIKNGQADLEELVKLIGPIVDTIYVKEPPVLGGLLLRDREKREPDIPLWYDQLPELSTRIPINGAYDYFHFVEKRNAKVDPQRGVPKPIAIEREFTLPPGQSEYHFPLYMGRGHNASLFVASLRSSAFPFKSAVRCSLKMTYTYGDSQPYNLVFQPVDGILKPMTVVWESTNKRTGDVANLPVPDFPVKYGWNELEANGTLEVVARKLEDMHVYVSGVRNSDLIAAERRKLDVNVTLMKKRLQMLIEKSKNIEVHIGELNDEWQPGKVVSVCAEDKNGNPFCFVQCNGVRVFCHSSRWADDVAVETLSRNDDVWVLFRRDDSPGKESAMWMSRSSDQPQQLAERIAKGRAYSNRIQVERSEIEARIASVRKQQDLLSAADVERSVRHKLENIRKACRLQVLNTWDNARSCRDKTAPAWFRERMGKVLQGFEEDFQNKAIPPQFKDELAELLYPLHRDIPFALIDADERDRSEHGMDASSARHAGKALGDAQEDWQKRLLDWMLQQVNRRGFSIYREFSIALWRCESLVLRLTAKNCRLLCVVLGDSIRNLIRKIENADAVTVGCDDPELFRKKTLASARYNFEVMLALIRTRKSKDASVSCLLVPGSDLANKLLNLVDGFAKVLLEHHLKLSSRISLKVDKPDSLKGTPDLLYALQLFLSGEDGASTISINEVGHDELDIEGTTQCEATEHNRTKYTPEERRKCPSRVQALFREKQLALNDAVGILYKPEAQGVHELRQGVWGCRYYTDGVNERPWEQAFLCVRSQQECLETHGGICDHWNKMGGWESALGLPMSDEEDFIENNQVRGRVSHFEHGDVIWLYDENRIDVRIKS